MEVRLLGPLEVEVDGGIVGVGGPRMRRLLASIALANGSVRSIEALVEAVWAGEDPPNGARRTVMSYVSRLRSVVGDGTIEQIEHGYRFVGAAASTDVKRFESLVVEGHHTLRAENHLQAAALFEEALRLWRGEPLAEFAGEHWAEPLRAQLFNAHLDAIEGRFAARVELGDHAEVLGALEREADEHPDRERLQFLHMLALYRSGRQSDALDRYESARRHLAAMGLDPSPELRDLEYRILTHDRIHRPAAEEGSVVRGYRLEERLRVGSFGSVYRASQASVGREVAIKVIAPELANDPRFVRRFETEAQLVARLEHPHIVPLYDYWRDPGGAFLVMRLLRGGSASDRLLIDGPLPVEAVARIVEEIGGALATAHARGVVHCDVKPANLLFDEDDRAYLADFGIAVHGADRSTITTSDWNVRRHPARVGVDPVLGSEGSIRSDVHAFGLTICELLGTSVESCRHDHSQALAAGSAPPVLPGAIDAVLERATSIDPRDRFDTVAELILAFRAGLMSGSVPDATHQSGPAESTGDEVPASVASASLVTGALATLNPYKGLRAFQEADAQDFFGRDRLVDELLTRVGRRRLVAVVGASGSGKSSLVRAGLAPVVATRGMFVTTIVPGAHPMEELENGLVRIATGRVPGLLQQITSSERGLVRAVRRVLPPDDSELLLVVDQFEEVFTLASEGEREAFIAGLVEAVTDDRSRTRVVVTIRADFFDRPLRHRRLGELLQDSTLNVLPMSRDELTAAIEAPAARLGVRFEPGLVDGILADVNHEPGALPLLQYALTQAFDTTDGATITIDTYRSIGGINRALGRRAEALWQAADPDEQLAARRLFGRLVSPGEGTEDTRRRTHLTELGEDPAIRAAIDQYGRARLLTFDHDPATREPTVEVAHEALIREWPRLRDWLDSDRDALRINRHLTIAAAGWVASNRDGGELYRGGRLETAVAWCTDHRADLNAVEREFVDASIVAKEAEVAAEQERFDEQIRSNRRLRVLVAVVSVIAVIAAVAGVFALQQRSRADDEAAAAHAQAEVAERARNEAEAAQAQADAAAAEASRREAEAHGERARAAESATEARAQADAAEAARQAEDVQRVRATAFEVVDRDLRLGLLLAVEAHRMDPSRENEGALHRLLSDTGGVTGTIPATGIGRIWLADDGVTAVTQSFGSVDVWDLDALEHVRTLDRPTNTGTRVGVSFATNLAAIADEAGTDLIDLDDNVVVGLSRERAIDLVFSPIDGSLAVAFGDRFELWDVSTPTRPELQTSRPWSVEHISWDPSGTAWVLVTGGQLEFWEVDAVAPRWTNRIFPDGQKLPIPALFDTLFSEDGGTLVYAMRNEVGRAVLRVVSTTDGSSIGAEASAVDSVVVDLLWLDEDRLQVAAAVVSDQVRAFDLTRGIEIDAPFPSQGIWALEYSDALDRIVEGGNNGIALRRGLASPLERRVPLLPEQTVIAGADSVPRYVLARDGNAVLISVPVFADWAPVVEYDLTAEPPKSRLTDLNGIVWGANGHTLLVNDTMVMIDEELNQLGEPVSTPTDARAFVTSPDGRFFALWGEDDGRVELYRSTGELVNGEILLPGRSPLAGVALSFSADGARLATYEQVGASTWAIWDTETGERIHLGDVEELVAPRWAGTELWAERPTRDFVQLRVDPVTFRPVGEPLVGHTGVRCHIVEDGASNLVATQSADGTARVWDQQTGKQLGAPIPTTACDVQWADGGNILATAGPGQVSIWNFDLTSWPDIACDIAGRNMTRAEWEEHGPRTVDQRATCHQFPDQS